MRGLVIVLLLVVIIASFGFVAANIDLNWIRQEKSKDVKFGMFTSAVCEDNGKFVNCKDEIFVNCNGRVSKAGGITECNGFRLDVPKASGFAVFEKGWRDPRD